jgi:hypothetical protein
MRALAEAAGIHVGLIASGPPGSPIRCLPEPVLGYPGSAAGGCPGVAG